MRRLLTRAIAPARQTPQDLLQDGLYKPLALALYPGPFWPVSVALVALNLGAVDLGSSGEGFSTASAVLDAAEVHPISEEAEEAEEAEVEGEEGEESENGEEGEEGDERILPGMSAQSKARASELVAAQQLPALNRRAGPSLSALSESKIATSVTDLTELSATKQERKLKRKKELTEGDDRYSSAKGK